VHKEAWSWLLEQVQALRELVPQDYPLLRLALPTQLLALVAVNVALWFFGVPRFPIDCAVGPIRAVAIIVIGETLFLAAFLVLKSFVREVKLPGYIEKLIEALRKTQPKDLAVTCILVGFVEELTFRGVLFPLLGLVPAALVFAALHRPRAPIHWAALTSLAIMFSVEVRLTGGLLVPMIHHGLHDFLALGLLHVTLKNDQPIAF
jgi:membrane protease YdiL (CAAX protease family)